MPIAGPISTGSHPKLLWPGIFDTWGQVYGQHPTQYTDLYDVHDSDKAFEEMLQITPFGLAPVKPEGQPGQFDSEVQGFLTRVAHTAFFLGYVVTYEEMRDNLYKEVATRRAESNAFSVHVSIEQVAAFLYNNAFSSTYFTTGDGVALGSAAHLNATGGTYSNILSPAADLSEASLEDACVQIMGYTNDRGLQIPIMPQSLHVARQEWFNANRILKSVLQPDSASNNINVLKATNSIPEGIKLNHYFTAAHAWHMRTTAPNGMYFFWRDRPTFDQDNDYDTKNAKAGTYFRFSVTVGDPKAYFGSNGP